jgi:hypothetical protein
MKADNSVPVKTTESLETKSIATDLIAKDDQTITEVNGPKGPEPTRFGDWERKGRCVDF